MAPKPKPKTMAADGVLDAAAPLPPAAPVADVTPAPLPETAPDGATQPADAMGTIVPPPDLTAAEAAFAAIVPASFYPVPEAAPVADPTPEALPLPEGHMFICTVLSPLAHDGVAYGIGAELHLSEDQMMPLLACGAVEAAR
jgi:hypothetical protein